MTTNPYAKIKQNSIMTASPQELTLMLYNGAIKFANQSLEAIKGKDYELANEKNIRVQNIVLEFRASLDFNYPVASDMDAMYEYMYRRLVEANISKDTDIMEEVIGLLREFRDTWKEAMELAKNKKAVVGAKTQKQAL